MKKHTHLFPILALNLLLVAACESAKKVGQQGSLTLYKSCNEIDRDLKEAQNQRNKPIAYATEDAAANSSGSNAPLGETNLQVQGVDEMDAAKADGDFIYLIDSNRQKLNVLKRNPKDSPSLLQAISLSKEILPQGLFLKSNHLILVAASYDGNGRSKVIVQSFPKNQNGTLSDPSEKRLDLGYVSQARVINSQLHLVTESNLYSYAADGSKSVLAEDLLPKEGTSNSQTKLTSCDRIYRPIAKNEANNPSSTLASDETSVSYTDSMMCVVSMNLDELNQAALANCLTKSSYTSTVYASEKNMFVVTQDGWNWNDQKNSIHQFRLSTKDQAGAYIGTALLEGYLLNSFSLDEYNGYLRVASTINPVSNTCRDDCSEPSIQLTAQARSNVVVNKVSSFELFDSGDPVLASQSEDLAPNERITSVRFIKDRGYVVTFRQVDPLFVLNLSNPKQIVKKGELKITGFSEYIHPVAEGYLLGIGREVDPVSNRSQGILVSLFDVRDENDPKLVTKLEVGDFTTSTDVSYDHHAFRFIAEHNLIVLPVNSWSWTSFAGSADLFSANADQGFRVIEIKDLSELVSKASVSMPNAFRSFYNDGVISFLGSNQLINQSVSSMGTNSGTLSF